MDGNSKSNFDEENFVIVVCANFENVIFLVFPAQITLIG